MFAKQLVQRSWKFNIPLLWLWQRDMNDRKVAGFVDDDNGDESEDDTKDDFDEEFWAVPVSFTSSPIFLNVMMRAIMILNAKSLR